MPQLETDAPPPSRPVRRVKAQSRASGSATALALTRQTGRDTRKGGQKPSTSNTVAELAKDDTALGPAQGEQGMRKCRRW